MSLQTSLQSSETQQHSRTSAETFSRAIFGRKNRLAVMAFLANEYGAEQPFYAAAVAEAMGLALNDVSAEIVLLERAGLVEFVGTYPGGRARFFRRRSSAMWRGASELMAEVQTADESGQEPAAQLTEGAAGVVP